MGLRRVRPAQTDLRIRYGSAQSLERGLPTELQRVEADMARMAADSGLKTRVVARDQGRLIHEIIVPREDAGRGVSFARSIFTPDMFDPRTRVAPGDEEALA